MMANTRVHRRTSHTPRTYLDTVKDLPVDSVDQDRHWGRGHGAELCKLGERLSSCSATWDASAHEQVSVCGVVVLVTAAAAAMVVVHVCKLACA